MSVFFVVVAVSFLPQHLVQIVPTRLLPFYIFIDYGISFFFDILCWLLFCLKFKFPINVLYYHHNLVLFLFMGCIFMGGYSLIGVKILTSIFLQQL